jgi:AraC-like DNA-binding protein
MTVEDFKTNKSVAVIDESNFLIGYIKEESTNRAILIGPVRFGELTDKDVSAIMNKYNLPKILEKNISRFLLSTPVFSTENFLVLLSLFHLSVNGKLVTIQEIMQNSSDTLSYQESKENYIETVDIETPHTTGDYEENIIYYIKNGMVDEIKKLHFENYTGSIGKLGPNQLRSIKNALIILNSICLRAAISGGLDTETAYTLGERYAQRIENAQSITQLGSLSPMIRNDYCQRVKNLTVPKIENLHIQKAINYIQKNIYSKITIAELAEHVGVKPEYLSALCKQTLNCTMSQYISERKIDEAKKLLRFTDKSLSEIATLLCFSSQSHFQTHFKKVRGITPMEYRDKYNKK